MHQPRIQHYEISHFRAPYKNWPGITGIGGVYSGIGEEPATAKPPMTAAAKVTYVTLGLLGLTALYYWVGTKSAQRNPRRASANAKARGWHVDNGPLGVYGGGFSGIVVHASVAQLKKRFGKGRGASPDGKVKFEWHFKDTQGNGVTLYDWRSGRRTPTEWHIGSESVADAKSFAAWLKKSLK